jgi:hypothetical protein
MKKFSIGINSLHFEFIACPKLWMTQDQLLQLRQRLRRIALKCFPDEPDYGFFRDMNHFSDKFITICSRNGQDICFNSLSNIGSYQGKKILHLGTVYSTVRSEGVMLQTYAVSIAYFFVKNWFRQFYVTSLTHTPRIMGSVATFFSDAFPAQEDHQSNEVHRNIAKIFMKTYVPELYLKNQPKLNANFVLKEMRRRNNGTIVFPDTYQSTPKHRQSCFNNFCKMNIDYENGDELLQIATFTWSNCLGGLKNLMKWLNVRKQRTLRQTTTIS